MELSRESRCLGVELSRESRCLGVENSPDSHKLVEIICLRLLTIQERGGSLEPDAERPLTGR